MAYYPLSSADILHHLSSCPSYLHSGLSQTYFHLSSSPFTTPTYQPEPPPRANLLPCPPPKPPDPFPFLSTSHIYSQPPHTHQILQPHPPWQEFTKEFTSISPPARELLQHRDELLRSPSRTALPLLAPPRAPPWTAPSQAPRSSQPLPPIGVSEKGETILPQPSPATAMSIPATAAQPPPALEPPFSPSSLASDETKENETESSLAPREPQRTPPSPPQAPPCQTPTTATLPWSPANMKVEQGSPFASPYNNLFITEHREVSVHIEEERISEYEEIRKEHCLNAAHFGKQEIEVEPLDQCKMDTADERQGEWKTAHLQPTNTDQDRANFRKPNTYHVQPISTPSHRSHTREGHQEYFATALSLHAFKGKASLAHPVIGPIKVTKMVVEVGHIMSKPNYIFLWSIIESNLQNQAIFEDCPMNLLDQSCGSFCLLFNLEDKVDFEGVGNDRGLGQRKIKRIIGPIGRKGVG